VLLTGQIRIAVTQLEFAKTDEPDSATETDQTGVLTELALVLGFNNQKTSDDQVASSVEADSNVDLPKDVAKSINRLFGGLSKKLKVAFPSCFSPTWKKASRKIHILCELIR